MFCLDTSIVIDIFRGDSALKKKMLKFQGQKFAITSVTLCELFKGAWKSRDTEKAVQLITDFYRSVELLDFDVASAGLFGQNRNILEKKGAKIPEADLMIASLAMANNKILVTRDSRHFKKVPELNVEKW